MNEQYVRTASFEVGETTATGAGPDRIAVATEDRRVEFAGPGGRTTATLDTAATDLALDTRAYAVCGDTVIALSYEGPRIWRVSIDGARAVETLPDAGVVAVLTDSHLIGLDAETGGERFRTDRPHADVAEVPDLVASDDRVYLSAWSFLSVFDASGDLLGEANLAGAIDHIGVLDRLVIAAMKDGRLIGVQPEDGGQRFEIDHDASWLAPRGTDALFCLAGNDLVTVDADGTVDRIGSAPDGSLVVSAGGDVACVVADGTVDVYHTRGGADSLDARVETEHVSPEQALDVTLTNQGDQHITTTPDVSGDNATYGSLEHLSLQPGERTTVSVPVRRVDPDAGETSVRLTCDGVNVLERTLEVEQPTEASVTGSLQRIVDAEAVVELTVETGANERRELRVEPIGASIPAIPPDDTETTELHVPLGTGTLHVTGDDLAESVTVDVPVNPLEVAVSTRPGFVDVRIENAAGVPVEDDIHVEAAWLPERIDRSLTLDPDSVLVLVLPTLEPGQQTIEIVSPTVNHEHTVDVDEPLELGRQRPGSSPAGASQRSTPRETAGPNEMGSTARGASEPNTDVRESTASTTRSVDGAAGSAAGAGDRSLSATRTLSSQTVSQNRALVEQITVEHDGVAPIPVTLTDAETERSLGDLEPGTEYTFLRWHAFTTVGEQELPEVVARTDGASASVPRRTVTVESATVQFGIEFHEADPGGDVRLSIVNDGHEPCTIHQLRIRGFDDWVSVGDLEVAPSTDATWETSVDDGVASGDAVEAFINYTLGEESGRCGSLAQVMPAKTDLADIEISVHDQTEFVEGYGGLALAVHNDGADTLDTFELEVQGDALDEFLRYEPEERNGFTPGESFVHEAPIKTDATDLSIPVRISATIDGTDVSEEFRVTGPVPDDEWTEEIQRAWHVDRDDSGTEMSDASECLATLPSHLIGEFRKA